MRHICEDEKYKKSGIVGIIKEDDKWEICYGDGTYDHIINYCPFCGVRLKTKIILEYNNAHPGMVFLLHQESDNPLMKKKRELEDLGYEVELRGRFMGYTHELDKLGLTEKLMKCSKEELEDILKEFGKK